MPAYAAEEGAAPPQQGSWLSVLPFIVIMLAFFFFTSRSTKKKQQAHDKMLSSLSRGDTVISAGGFFGKIVDILDDSFIIEVADGVRVRILRNSITAQRDTGDAKQKPHRPKKKKRISGRPERSLDEAAKSEEKQLPASEEVTPNESAALMDEPENVSAAPDQDAETDATVKTESSDSVG
jgi:preprotein translocase subunit YajC